MTVSLSATIAGNLEDVRARIAEACLKGRRAPDSVRLIAVTKTAQLDWIRALIELGQLDLGENRPQQLAQRAAELPQTVRWHLIGHLQRNKVELIWPRVQWIHSVDSLRLLRSLASFADKSSISPQILLEVNVSGETSKGGFAPDELSAAWDEIQASSLPVVGLMTMAPLANDPATVRPVFRGLRELRDRLAERSGKAFPLPELSMGMSGDFEVAVEEGATMVRIGSRLFEGLEGNAECGTRNAE
jgi:PLP dependent protein